MTKQKKSTQDSMEQKGQFGKDYLDVLIAIPFEEGKIIPCALVAERLTKEQMDAFKYLEGGVFNEDTMKQNEVASVLKDRLIEGFFIALKEYRKKNN